KPWVTFRPSAEERRAGDLCCDGSRTLLSLSNPNKRTHSTRRNRVALGLRSYSSLTLSRVIQVFSFSSSSGTMNVAHGSSLNNDLVLHPYIVSESRELFFHLILQVAYRSSAAPSAPTVSTSAK